MAKKVYTEESFTRNPWALLKRIRNYLIGRWKRLAAVIFGAFLFLFTISCISVLVDANMSGGYALSIDKVQGSPAGANAPPIVQARSAALIEYSTGRMIYGKNEHEKLPMASTTKMMTALVVRKYLKLNEMVTISKEASKVGEQEIWLEADEKLSVKDLLYALLIHSANDAAYALAERTGGSIDAFCAMMNRISAEIGARESHYTNPHGLDQPGHYSTAYDLAVVARKLLSDPVLAKMVKLPSYQIRWPSRPYPRVCQNHNELLRRYEGANGIKTGYTLGAGQCLVGSATRNGVTLISVVLNSPERINDSARLLDYGFSMTERICVRKKGAVAGTTRVSSFPVSYVRVVCPSDIWVVSIKGRKDIFTVKTSINRKKKAPIEKGLPLGAVRVYLGGEKISSMRVVSSMRCPASSAPKAVGYFMWYSLCNLGRFFSAPFRIV